jgi:hypothetical protein
MAWVGGAVFGAHLLMSAAVLFGAPVFRMTRLV